MANTSELNILINAKDNASRTLEGFGSTLKSIGAQATIASSIVAGALGVLGKSAIDSASEMEQNRIAFETMLGTADKASTMLRQISDFARRTPFELPQVVEGTKRLLAYGIEQEKLLPNFEMLGNIAAGVGKDKLPFLTLAFGQVRAAGRLTGAELRQFSEAGVPMLEGLGKHFKKNGEQIREMVSDGKVGFKDVEAVLASMTGEGGKFFNLMGKQSKSFSGTLSNINDNFGRLLRGIVGINEAGEIRKGSIFEIFKNGATGFLIQLDKVTPQIIKLADAIAKNKTAIFVIAGALTGALAPALIAATTLAGSLALSLAPFVLLGAAIGFAWQTNLGGIQQKVVMLGGVLVEFWKRISPIFNSMRESANRIFDSLKRVFGDVSAKDLQNVANILAFAFGTTLVIALKLVAGALDMVAKTMKTLEPATKAVINVLKTVVDLISKVSSAIGKLPNGSKILDAAIKSGFRTAFPGLPKFASGGFVGGKLGEPQLAVVHGGEKVLSPNMQDAGGSMGGITINMSGSFNLDSEQRVDELARRITQMLGRQTELARIGVN